MEAASTSETSVSFYRTARRKNPEDSHLPYICLHVVTIEKRTPNLYPIKWFIPSERHSERIVAAPMGRDAAD
jgi:hypothetical protein